MPLHFRKPLDSSSEDVLKQLADYEVVILMDDSMSMIGKRWKLARKATKGVVKKAILYDKNGIEIRFLNSDAVVNLRSGADVKSLFKEVQPCNGTPLGNRLGVLCRGYLTTLAKAPETKRCLIVVITDGMPNSADEVYSTIKETARDLEQLDAPLTQLGIQFVQIGDDRSATKFLQDLDNNLKGQGENKVSRDIVDTVPYRGKDLTAEELVKILVGAINRRVDNQNKAR